MMLMLKIGVLSSLAISTSHQQSHPREECVSVHDPSRWVHCSVVYCARGSWRLVIIISIILISVLPHLLRLPLTCLTSYVCLLLVLPLMSAFKDCAVSGQQWWRQSRCIFHPQRRYHQYCAATRGRHRISFLPCDPTVCLY